MTMSSVLPLDPSRRIHSSLPAQCFQGASALPGSVVNTAARKLPSELMNIVVENLRPKDFVAFAGASTLFRALPTRRHLERRVAEHFSQGKVPPLARDKKTLLQQYIQILHATDTLDAELSASRNAVSLRGTLRPEFSSDGTVLMTGQKVYHLPSSMTAFDLGLESCLPTAAALSFDGRAAVTAGIDASHAIVATTWNLASWPPTRCHGLSGHSSVISSTCFSSSGHEVAVGSVDCDAKIWDLRASPPVARDLISYATDEIPLILSSDGRALLTLGAKNAIQFWNLSVVPPVKKSLSAHRDSVGSATFSLDGRYVAIAFRNNLAQVWDVMANPCVVQTLSGPGGSIDFAQFSPNSRYLVTACTEKIARVWDLEEGAASPGALLGPTNEVRGVSFSPDSRYVVTIPSAVKPLQVWDLFSSPPVSRELFGHTQRVHHVSFSPDGRFIVGACLDESIRLWRAPFAKSCW